MLEYFHYLNLLFLLLICSKRGGNPRRCCMDGRDPFYLLINSHLRTAFSIWWISQRDNGMNSTTTSKAKNTPSKKKLRLQTWLTFHWQDRQRLALVKVVKATDATLIQSSDLQRGRAMASRDQSFSKLWNVGSAVNTVTSPLNAAVDGLGGRDGILMDLTQAVREDRPIGKVGIGGVATKEKGGLQMIGGAQQHQAPLHHLLSQHSIDPSN